MTYASLFAGIGGFDLALNRLGHQCVYVNEWDKYAAQIYEKNFGHKPDTRDIRAVDVSEISDHDLLVGGFPCQAFSIAGKRQGFNETRGTLFFEICRIAAAKRTPYLLLENVKGLLSHDSGKTFATIIRSLDGMGYDCQWQVLNSKDFGVPQIGKECSLSDILEDNVDQKYFLSESQTKFVLDPKRQEKKYTQVHSQHVNSQAGTETISNKLINPDIHITESMKLVA